jgi:hypothetical protein
MGKILHCSPFFLIN